MIAQIHHQDLFIVPPLEQRTCIPGGYLPKGAFAKFLNISSGTSRKAENPFSVFFTSAAKTMVKRKRSVHVVLTLTV